MPYQGNTPLESYIATVKDSFSGNGSTTAFTMSKPTQVNDVRVVVENVIQDPSVAYTVSGTTITFTSAPPSGTNNIYVIHLGPAVATAQPPAEIADATTFASNVSVQGSFTSPGIDDNADAVALTIDSSEVVLVGKTSNTFSQQGVVLRANNDSQITRDGGNPFSLNRTSSDGNILSLYKDGSTVGTIGAVSGRTFLNSQGGALSLRTAGSDRMQIDASYVYPQTDNSYDLGSSGNRFKDAYLSGGIHLGGTGSANKLDDYEEGSCTLRFQGSGGTNDTTASFNYIKIGAMVNVYGNTGSTVPNATGVLHLDGLPFNSNSTNRSPGAVLYRHLTPPSGAHTLVAYIGASSNNIDLYWSSSANYTPFNSSNYNTVGGADFYMNMIYQTNS